MVGFLESHVKEMLAAEYVRVTHGKRFSILGVDHWLAIGGEDWLRLKLVFGLF